MSGRASSFRVGGGEREGACCRGVFVCRVGRRPREFAHQSGDSGSQFDASATARLVWLVVVLAALSPLAVRILRSVRERALQGAVAVYMVVISLMAASALASGRYLAVAGAALFLASDTMIAWNRFVRPFEWAPTAIIVTYHLGQIALVHSLRG